ncbi:hypothetical protein CLU79DRAFT_833169 [Phycomyces nitens]|nr:hypothetical protein CLU79DRAFT_833169 [Phycomyces nitens]
MKPCSKYPHQGQDSGQQVRNSHNTRMHSIQQRQQPGTGLRGIDTGLQVIEDDDEEEDDEEEEDEDDDEDEEEMIIEDTSSMSSSPSIPDENINFDLVYALHTFVATVEGQASVVKGDALILMEDTNIYWWLVEVFKTREMGYIPAENIETPYERLARLNKHRNVELTSPRLENVENIEPTRDETGTKQKRVVIASGSGATQIFHFEVESDVDEDQDDSDEDDRTEDSISMATNDQTKTPPANTDWQEQQWDLESPILRKSFEDAGRPSSCEAQELRVFAGNIGKGPLFHAFMIGNTTTAEELVKEAVVRFGIQDFATENSSDCTIEHYLAVQGLDGDDYVLAGQDKPLSIFRTLTAPLTTPMPSLSHIRRISQQESSQEGRVIQARSRRPRSSSFSSYEQTSYDEDSVLRFYLHRRIKRAHEKEGLIYIKVSLYPDENVAIPSKPHTSRDDAFTTNPTPSTPSKKKPSVHRTEIDRIDKIIAVRQELQVGAVINAALDKFHVPDAEADNFGLMEQSHDLPGAAAGVRRFAKYRMSVRANGKEWELQPLDLMSTVLHQQHPSAPHGPVTSDLLFILSRSDIDPVHRPRHAPRLAGVARALSDTCLSAPPMLTSQDRRPSILDILMDSRLEDRRPSATSTLDSSRGDERRPLGTLSQERKSSLTPQGGPPGSSQGSLASYPNHPGKPNSPSSALSPPSLLGFRRSSVTSSNISGNSLSSDTAIDSSSSMARSNSLQPSSVDSAAEAGKRKKESSFKQQLKRLVGWGSKSRKTPPAALSPQSTMATATFDVHPLQPSLSCTTSPSMLQPIDARSDFSFASAPCSARQAMPGTPHSMNHPSQSTLTVPESTGGVRRASAPTTSISSDSAKQPPSRRLSAVSSVSSESTSTDSDTEDSKHLGQEILTHSPEDEIEDKEHFLAVSLNPGLPPAPEPLLTDIQAQYAMWIGSQDTQEEAVQSPTLAPQPAARSRQIKVVPAASKAEQSISPPPPPPSCSPPPPPSTAPASIPASTSTLDSTDSTDKVISNSPPAKSVTDTIVTPLSVPCTPAVAQIVVPEKLPAQSIQAVHAVQSVQSVQPVQPVQPVQKVQPAPPVEPYIKPTHQSNAHMSSNGLDDLFLLVAHGVDFLQTRENSQWEDEGGYEYHPWNRSEGSFAVRSNKKNPKPTILKDNTEIAPLSVEKEEEEILPSTILLADESEALVAEGVTTESVPAEEDKPLSPPPTPLPRQQKQDEGIPKKVAKPEYVSPPTPAHFSSKVVQTEGNMDEELQRIVAAHIVF